MLVSMQCGLRSRRKTMPVIAYATWNPSDKHADITLSNGDLTAAHGGGGFKSARATVSKSSGKWYFEITVNSATSPILGYLAGGDALTPYPGDQAGQGFDGYRYYPVGQFQGPFTGSIGVTTVRFAYDLDSGKGFIGTGSSWLNSGDPVAGTGAIFTGISGAIFPACGLNGHTVTANFGATAFAQSVPSGYNSGWYS